MAWYSMHAKHAIPGVVIAASHQRLVEHRERDSMNCQDRLLHNCLQQSSLPISPAHTFLPVSNQLVFQAFELHTDPYHEKKSFKQALY